MTPIKFPIWMERLARRRMVARLPYPDPVASRRRRWWRYRIGLALMRPYLDRMLRHYSMAADDYSLPQHQRDHCTYMAIGLQYATGINSEVGFGDSDYLAKLRSDT